MYATSDFKEPDIEKEKEIVPPYSSYLLNDQLQDLIKESYDPSKPLVSLKQITINNKTTKLNQFYLFKKIILIIYHHFKFNIETRWWSYLGKRSII